MPDGTPDLLTRFLHQSRGRLSKRARRREFQLLTPEEAKRVEVLYSECFVGDFSPPSPDRTTRLRDVY